VFVPTLIRYHCELSSFQCIVTISPSLVQVELVEPLALLRRPFSIAGHGDDARGTWLDIIHRVVGVGTRWLAELRGGDAVDLNGLFK